MPGFDGTGPRGQGSMTGGGFGFCRPGTENRNVPADTRRGRGFFGWWRRGGRRGFGLGFGEGGYGYDAAGSVDQEKLLRENEELRARIESLEKKMGGQG